MFARMHGTSCWQWFLHPPPTPTRPPQGRSKQLQFVDNIWQAFAGQKLYEKSTFKTSRHILYLPPTPPIKKKKKKRRRKKGRLLQVRNCIEKSTFKTSRQTLCLPYPLQKWQFFLQVRNCMVKSTFKTSRQTLSVPPPPPSLVLVKTITLTLTCWYT